MRSVKKTTIGVLMAVVLMMGMFPVRLWTGLQARPYQRIAFYFIQTGWSGLCGIRWR